MTGDVQRGRSCAFEKTRLKKQFKYTQEEFKMRENSSKGPSIYVQAVVALLFINLVHKIVREIPGSLNLAGAQGTGGGVVTIMTAIILALSITLLFFRIKWGLILGFVPAIWAMLQWVLVHVIMGHPDRNGIWWYPIFPITQGALIIYFSIVAWRDEKSFQNEREV